MKADFSAVTKSLIGQSRGPVSEESDGFYVMCTGQVESAQFQGYDNLYCRYSMCFGPDWRIKQGVDTGLSQIAQKGANGDNTLIWNFPIDVTFKATNAHGWPRLVLSVYGVDLLGRDVIRGYGSTHIPTVAGRYTRYVRMFSPVSSSWVQQALAFVQGNPPEFFDSKFVAQGEGREVTRVESNGVVKVVIHVMTRNMSEHGYTEARIPQEHAAGTRPNKQLLFDT